jgi:diguanylate cyclase (GGDEF)-like protein
LYTDARMYAAKTEPGEASDLTAPLVPGGAGGGRWLASLLAVVTLLLLVSQLWVGMRSADRRIGLVVRESAAGLEVTAAPPGLPAAQAGLAAGDTVVRVAGVPVANTTEYNRVADFFRKGKPIEFVIKHGSEVRVVPIAPGVPFVWLDFLISAVTALCFLGVGLLAFLQRFGDLRAHLLFMFSGAVAIELSLPTGTIGYPVLTTLVTVLFYVLTGLQIGTELHLASVLPERQRWIVRHGWVVPMFYVAGAAVAVAATSTLVAEQVLSIAWWPWSFQQVELAVNDVSMPVWAAGIVVLLAIPAFRFPQPEGRQQAGLVLLGALPWAGIVFWSTAANVVGYDIPRWVDSLWSPLLLCYPVAVFIAIYRYHLFDIEFLVRRSLTYAVLTGALLLLFYAVLGAGSAFLSEAVAGTKVSVWVVAAATLLLGLLFAPLRSLVQRLIDHMFFPERQSQYELLTGLAHELASQGKLPAMGRRLVLQLREIFAVDGITLLLADPKSGVLVTLASSRLSQDRDLEQSFLLAPDDPGVRLLRRAKRPLPAAQLKAKSASFGQRLEYFQAVVAVPLLAHDELVGVLLVGAKVGGRRFPAEELELLNLFSHNVAAVLENARLFESATFENLTGLLRREAILDQLKRELERARRYGRPLAVGMADLDRFKAINDSYGHLAGDTVLTVIAQALSAGLRSSDTVGRYGGDEFLFVLPETDLESGVAVAEKIRGLVEQVRVNIDQEFAVTVTVSIGLASIGDLNDPDRPLAEALVGLADENLYRAKQRGGNRVEPAPIPVKSLLSSY